MNLVSMTETMSKKYIYAHGKGQFKLILPGVSDPKQGSTHCGQGVDGSTI